MRDFYRILGIPDNASMADIKSAYRRLAKQYHPDLNPGSKQSEEKFKEILDAYTILSDDELRAQYDRKRKFGSTSTAYYSSPPHTPGDKKREPPRKEYPPEYIEKMRQRNKTRIVRQINRRKKILRGMIITFVLYMFGAIAFEGWIKQPRSEREQAMLDSMRRERVIKDSVQLTDVIQNMDSPFDSVFGPGQTTWLSPNQVVVINPYSDAVVCLVQDKPPYRTLRNEFVHSRNTFIMKEVPNGSYRVKVYTGLKWNDTAKAPDGRLTGGFSTNERFFSIQREPITLLKPTYNNRNTITTDTVRIDTSGAQIRAISRAEFFNSGDTL